MKLPVAVLAISFVVLCTAVASQQTDPLAEQQFKNIVSFKGQKASAIVPAMEFMSASLGEPCSYCHVDDRSSDEKRAKQTAREMIAMQKEINDKNFHGRNQVTCATCHAGHERPVSVPPITGLDVRARRSQDVSADQVLAAYAKALSSEASGKVDGAKMTGKLTAHGQTNSVEGTYASGKIFLLIHSSQGDQKQGFNGTTVWFTTPNGVQNVPLEFGIRFVRENALYLSPGDLPKQDAPTGGTAKIDGKDMMVLTGTLIGSTDRASYFFDKSTGLLARATFYYPTILGNIEQIDDYSNYLAVGGVQIPMKVVIRAPEGDQTIEFSTATLPHTVDAATFEPPK